MQIRMKAFFSSLWCRAVLFAITYYGAALVSQLISFPNSSLPTIWLPSGVLVAVLLRAGIRNWPAYLLAVLPASIVYSVQFRLSLLDTSLVFIASILEATAGAWLIRRFNKETGQFNTPQHVLHLIIFSAIISSAMSASIITTVMAALQPGLSFWATWQIAWISRALGILIAAPLLLSWAEVRLNMIRKSDPERLIELAILITGLFVCSLYIFVGSFSLNNQSYLVVPFLVWVALRFGPQGTSASGLIVALVASWGTVQHLELFAVNNATIAPTMHALGSFLGITLVTCYILATQWEQSKRIEKALRESEERYRLLIENQGEGIGFLDKEDAFTFANPAAEQIFGLYPNSLEGHSLKEFVSPAQFGSLRKQLTQHKGNQKINCELEISQPDGKRRNLLVTATARYDSSQNFAGTFALFYDNTERKQVEVALRDSRSRYQTLFDHSPIAIWEEDFSRIKRLVDSWRKEGIEDIREYLLQNPDKVETCRQLLRVLDVNQAVLQEFQYTEKAEFMAHVNKMIFNGPKDIFIAEMAAIAEGKMSFEMEGPNDIRNGVVRHHAVRWTAAPGYEQDYRRVIVTIIDITERKQAEERMRYMSTHDLLTGIYNRNFFEAELERLQDSRLEPVNVMVVDINGMKATNDSHGHAAGDELLRRAAQVLKLSFRKEDVIARIGGDEFVVLFHGAVQVQEAVERVKECLRDHNHWYDGPPLSLAIGAASGGKGSSLVNLYKKADQIMYKEKLRPRRSKVDNRTDGAAGSGDSPPSNQNSL
jgi:diguanylate cyclase (GGDEF)-like protein/PAS domain S-box-containing protein